MCTGQTTAATLHGWLRDPMIRLVMASDGVTDHEMIALVRRIGTAAASRPNQVPAISQLRQPDSRLAW